MFRSVCLSLIFLPALLAAAGREFPSANDIPRFQSVADGLYRGGQPNRNGFEFLKDKGIKTVINLRAESDEGPIVKRLGMNYVQIPIDELKPWSQISEGAIAKYFEIVNNPANYPIFFHCKRGADRTGAMAAFYRIAIQGWSAKQAFDEARNVGMRWWYPVIRDQVYEFKPKWVPILAKAEEPATKPDPAVKP